MSYDGDPKDFLNPAPPPQLPAGPRDGGEHHKHGRANELWRRLNEIDALTDEQRVARGLPTRADIEMKTGRIPIPTVPAKMPGGPHNGVWIDELMGLYPDAKPKADDIESMGMTEAELLIGGAKKLLRQAARAARRKHVKRKAARKVKRKAARAARRKNR